MTLAELADHLGVSPRQIRFLIAEDILPAAEKTGRAADAYTETHLAQARRYFALYRMGMKPASIKVLMSFDQAIPIFQASGVELRIAASAEPVDVEALIADLSKAVRTYFSKD
ncbi:helix-turn-helix domain-containing protein [Rhodobacter sp. KR11]|jgi:DNA-binding transcriptional MerR regulator|uniref:helix-turn-helix domain-containing protein n=1 Tax=Rhodobacter sp. KR11 TaxID=2974588 RepID=UPI002222E24F|nr:helix-turn-helix domain-containing protein [Rhodobacter sp. KR11]MCW1918022.1 helix-turn-helix domain-containing protein [Rhodobacter sp. KR11]